MKMAQTASKLIPFERMEVTRVDKNLKPTLIAILCFNIKTCNHSTIVKCIVDNLVPSHDWYIILMQDIKNDMLKGENYLIIYVNIQI